MSDTYQDLTTLQKADTVLSVLAHQGRGRTIEEACSLVHVPTSTFYSWRKDATVQKVMREITGDVKNAVSAKLIQNWSSIIDNMIDIALGVSHDPENYVVYPRDVIAAFKELKPIMQEVMEEAPRDTASEEEFLKSQGIDFSPKQARASVEVPIEDEEVNITVRRGKKPLDVTPE